MDADDMDFLYHVYTITGDGIVVNEYQSNTIERAEDHFRANVDAEVNLAIRHRHYNGATVHLFDTWECRTLDTRTINPNPDAL